MPSVTPQSLAAMSKLQVNPAGRIVYRGPKNAIYLNLTNRCSCDCEFCLRSWSDGLYGVSLILDVEPGIEDVTTALELEFLSGPADEIVFCGFGEPTMRLDLVLAVTEWLHLRRLPARLDTNGHGSLLNPDVDVPVELARAGLNAVTVSLNAADPLAYERICRPAFAKAHRAVLRFAEDCLANGITTTLTAVEHPDADLAGCQAIAQRLGAAFRVRARVVPGAEGKGDMP